MDEEHGHGAGLGGRRSGLSLGYRSRPPGTAVDTIEVDRLVPCLIVDDAREEVGASGRGWKTLPDLICQSGMENGGSLACQRRIVATALQHATALASALRRLLQGHVPPISYLIYKRVHIG